MENLAPLIAASLNAGTPLLIAAIGLLINERAGVLNLGAEGMMLVAAISGFIVAYASGSAMLGFAAGIVAGMLMAALFAWLSLILVTSQVPTGLALSIFGVGISAFMGQKFVGISLPIKAYEIPYLADIPFIGQALFHQHFMAYLGLALCAATIWFLYRTRAGLVLRSILFGGACCSLAGAYLSQIYTPMWVEGMVAGRCWIALALPTFATWRPGRVVLGAILFGGVTILQFYMQGQGVSVPSQILSMLPYAATIVVLALISRNPDWIRLNMPASLGRPFRRGSA
ncbi:MAG: ABC transporter permease [Candidatus Protistobacter heckmanni]|nr:ABC transporter permease [Candidatus Protistobacter heckmanni]